MNLEEAQTFVEMNSKQLNEYNRQSRCISGRYELLNIFPMVAKPGADAGDVMAAFGALNLLSVTLPIETVINAVVTVVGGIDNFRFHTDDHTEPTDVGAGCSHLNLAKTNPESYGITQDQIDALFFQLPALVEQGAQQLVLHGDHSEQAVIIIDSEYYGVTPLVRLGPTVRAAYVYHKTLHTQQLDKLVKLLQEALAAQGQAIEDFAIRKAVDDAFGKQMAETIKQIAAGLSVYTANIDEQGVVTIGSF